MSSKRPHTARKPVGSGSAFRPVPEYGPSAGQITSSPYVNAIPSAVSELSVDSKYDPAVRRQSRESVNSDRFYDTEQQPEAEAATTAEATSPTIAQAPSLFPHNTPAHLYHRFDGSRNKDPSRAYQRLPSEAPEPSSQAASRTPSNASNQYPWSYPDAYTSSSSTLSKVDQTYTRQSPAQPTAQPAKQPTAPPAAQPAAQPYPMSRHDSPASQYSEFSAYPMAMPDMPSPVVPDIPAHTVLLPQPSGPSAHSTHSPHSASSGASIPFQNSIAPAHSIPAPTTSYNPFVDYTSEASQPKQDVYAHFKRPYLEAAEEDPRRSPIERSEWYSQPHAPPHAPQHAQPQHAQPQHGPQHAQPQARPPKPLPSKYGHPFAVYGEPYVKDGSSLDDEARESSDRSLSPAHSETTDRDSSLSVGSEPLANNPMINPANVPAAVSELPPGALYRRQVSTSARPRHGTPLTLASLANRNSSSDLSPHASGTQLDTPSSIVSYPPYVATAMATDSPASDQPSEAPSHHSRASASSFGDASQKSRLSRDTNNLSPTLEAPAAEKPKDESLGIGVGSAYVQRVRVDAAETHISKVPAVLPIGIRARGKPQAARLQPEFLRKAMDIRYTHLPQRMLETEVDDDDVPLGQQKPPGVAPRPASPPPAATAGGGGGAYESLDPSRRSHSPVDSVMERPGKIKLFVANPDDESD